MIFKYNIEGTDSAEYETEFTQDMLLEEKFFEVDFQKLDVPVLQVRAREKLHIMAKIEMGGSALRFNYGYSGNTYATIPGQECEFTVDSSEFNSNSSS